MSFGARGGVPLVIVSLIISFALGAQNIVGLAKS